jgi:hypothetical protein
LWQTTRIILFQPNAAAASRPTQTSQQLDIDFQMDCERFLEYIGNMWENMVKYGNTVYGKYMALAVVQQLSPSSRMVRLRVHGVLYLAYASEQNVKLQDPVLRPLRPNMILSTIIIIIITITITITIIIIIILFLILIILIVS